MTTPTQPGGSAADIDARLPRRFFVKRGDVQAAFGLTKQQMRDLVNAGVFVAKYPAPARPAAKGAAKALFVRSEVLAVARKWEST
jgi:hypothetical protein